MAKAAHPDAMAPSKPGRTRTAPPRMPAQFPMEGRYRSYVLFDAAGLIYLLLGLLAVRVVWALGTDSQAWVALQEGFQNPIYLAFHALALIAVLFVGVRFFALFPKAQPPRIGPLRPPAPTVILGILYATWALVSALFVAVLAGGIV